MIQNNYFVKYNLQLYKTGSACVKKYKKKFDNDKKIYYYAKI